MDHPGDYCVGGRLYTPMPRVIMDGGEELSFPIPDAQIRALIAAAERAPYGKGTETLVDRSVRDCWQIDATRVRLAGRAWPDSFAKVMELVAAGLGLPAARLDVELYKLLVYRPGGFFAEHRDTEKVPGMVATLSLSLPTPGAGGELVVRHGGREEVFDLNAGEPSELAFAAFYADCLHEVRPLAEGHRIALIFNLFLGSSGDTAGAPDYSDLAAPVAECLARWRDEGSTDKLVWLLDHEYSEGGLSFDTLKNADATVAQVLGDAAARVDCELHAAVLRIEEFGLPQYGALLDDWDWGWDREWADYQDVGPEAEMGAVEGQREALDGWATRDGRRPPFGEIPLNALELLPHGALDGAEPDHRRLKGSTGNTGPTLKFVYRRAALVIWPRERTVDIVASGSIDRAVSWVETQHVGVGHEDEEGSGRDNGGARIPRLLGRLTALWPIGYDAHDKHNRSAMLRLLGSTGEAEVAADFLHRVIAANYDGTENKTLAAVLPVVGPGEAREFLPRLVDKQLRRRFRDVVEMLVLAAAECAGGRSERGVVDPALGEAWREVLSDAVAAALSGLDTAFQSESEVRPDEENCRPAGAWLRLLARHGRAQQEKWIDHQAISGLLILANGLGLHDESGAAAEVICGYPHIVTPDRILPSALAQMHKRGTLPETTAYGVLWRQSADVLLKRSSTAPAKPTSWTIAADINCECELCTRLTAFCDDPARREERFKVRSDLRGHLHRTIDRHRLDLDHETERDGSPYTLVCTKNRASHERRLAEYAEDLRHMGSLHARAPVGEQRGDSEGRLTLLGRAVKAAERSPAVP